MPNPMKLTIQYPDFEKIDFRVGRVVQATAPAWSHKLLELAVDFGPELGERTILTGIRQWYQPEDLVDKQFVFVVNLAERKMGEGVSQGMIFLADTPEKPLLLPVDQSIPTGATVR